MTQSTGWAVGRLLCSVQPVAVIGYCVRLVVLDDGNERDRPTPGAEGFDGGYGRMMSELECTLPVPGLPQPNVGILRSPGQGAA